MDIISITEYKTRITQKGLHMNKLKNTLRTKGYAEDHDVIARANEVGRRFFADCPGVKPIIKLLNQFGIKVYENDMEIKAYITVNARYADIFGSTKIACVRKDISVGFKRFALAHELAHYIFDYDDAQEPDYYNTYDGDSDSEEEHRANLFASNLLMPEDEFRSKREELLKETTHSIPDTQAALAEYFGVEVRAIQRRYEELGIKENE